MSKIIIFKIFLTCILIFIVINQINLSNFISKLQNNKLSLIFIAFFIQHLSLIFSSYRSNIYLQDRGIFLSKSQNIILYYVGSFYNNFLPGGVGGDGYKIYFLSKHHTVRKITLLKLFLLERINGVFVLIYLGCLLYCWSDFNICLHYFTYLILLIGIPGYILFSKLLLKDNCSIKGLPFSACTQILQLIMIYLIILSFNQNLDNRLIIDYMLLFSIASIISIFPITIGGIGLREAVFIAGTKIIPSLDQDLGILFASTSFLITLSASLIGGILIFYNKSSTSQ